MIFISDDAQSTFIPIFINEEQYKLLTVCNKGKTQFWCHRHGKRVNTPLHERCMYKRHNFFFIQKFFLKKIYLWFITYRVKTQNTWNSNTWNTNLTIFLILKPLQLHDGNLWSRPPFFVLAIVVDGPRWMSSDPFKVGYSNLLIFFKQYIKNKIYFFPFLYLC